MPTSRQLALWKHYFNSLSIYPDATTLVLGLVVVVVAVGLGTRPRPSCEPVIGRAVAVAGAGADKPIIKPRF